MDAKARRFLKRLYRNISDNHPTTSRIEERVMDCIVDGAFGIYVPQCFAERYSSSPLIRGVDPEEWKILLKGPDDNATYWEVWDSVLQNFHLDDGRILYQEGDLFLCSPGALEEQE